MLFFDTHVFLFVIVAGASNILFALSLSPDPIEQGLFILIACGSVAWTVRGLDTAVRQWSCNQKWRAGASLVLWVIAICFDLLAGYGLLRSQQLDLQAKQSEYSLAVADAKARVQAVQTQLAAMPVTSVADANASLAALPAVSASKCREALLPNKMRRVAAQRIRNACQALTDARRAVSRAEARATLVADLGTARADLRKLVSRPPIHDARGEILPAQSVALGIVVLITTGAVLGVFAVRLPDNHGRTLLVDVVSRRLRSHVPEIEKDDRPQITFDGDVEDRILALAGFSGSELSPLKLDAGGYVTGTQRQIASRLGVNPTQINRALSRLRENGQITMTVGKITKFKIAK